MPTTYSYHKHRQHDTQTARDIYFLSHSDPPYLFAQLPHAIANGNGCTRGIWQWPVNGEEGLLESAGSRISEC